MAAVSINQGMPGPEEPALGLPRERWRLLAMARRRWAEIDLPHDCRLMRTVVDEAPLLAEELGLESGKTFLTDYLSLDLNLVGRVLGWLDKEQPMEAVPLAVVASQAQPLAEHGTNQHSEKESEDVITSPPQRGTTGQSYLLRRLARDAPDILERVKAGEFRSARAAAIEAGIIKPAPIVRLVDDPLRVAAAIKKHLTHQQFDAFFEALLQDRHPAGPRH